MQPLQFLQQPQLLQKLQLLLQPPLLQQPPPAATIGTAGDDCGSKKLAPYLIGEVMAYRDFGASAA